MAVDRNYMLNKMSGRIMKPEEFDYDRLSAPPLYSLLSQDDIDKLRKLATSIRYQARPVERLKAIDDIMRSRGFVKFAGGTNRVVYRYIEDDSFLVKVASDAVGMRDNPREYMNQFIYKPFVCKIFEVSQCGTVAVVERCLPITSREEFMSVAADVYYVISNWFIGEYVMDDIGTDYFLNWSLRKGFGPVLIDYPYAYKLDGNKLYCNRTMEDGSTCGGVIDYDDGFNHLRCTKCGKRYKAIELKKAEENGDIIRRGGYGKMKVSFGYGDSHVVTDTEPYMDVTPKFKPRRRGRKSRVGTLTVECGYGHKNPINRARPTEEAKPDPGKLKVEFGYNNTEDITVVSDDVIDTVEAEDIKMASNNVDIAEETDVPESTSTTISVKEDGTRVYTDEEGKSHVLEPVEDTSDEDEYEEDEIIKVNNNQPYLEFFAKTTNTAEIDGNEEEKVKCLLLVDSKGDPYRVGDNTVMIVTSIDDHLLSDTCIVAKDANRKLIDEIESLRKQLETANKVNNDHITNSGELDKENIRLTNSLNEANADLDKVRGRNKVLSERNRELEDQIATLNKKYDDAMSGVKTSTESYNKTIKELSDKCTAKDEQIKKLKDDEADRLVYESGLEEDNSRLETANTRLTNANKDLQTKYSELDQKHEDLIHAHADLQAEKLQLLAEIHNLEEELYEDEEDNNEQQSEEEQAEPSEVTDYEASSPFFKEHDEEEPGQVTPAEPTSDDSGDYMDDYFDDPDAEEPVEEEEPEEEPLKVDKNSVKDIIRDQMSTVPPVGSVPPANMKPVKVNMPQKKESINKNSNSSSNIIKTGRRSEKYNPDFYEKRGLKYEKK